MMTLMMILIMVILSLVNQALVNVDQVRIAVIINISTMNFHTVQNHQLFPRQYLMRKTAIYCTMIDLPASPSSAQPFDIRNPAKKLISKQDFDQSIAFLDDGFDYSVSCWSRGAAWSSAPLEHNLKLLY